MYRAISPAENVSTQDLSLVKVHPTFFKLAIVFSSIAIVLTLILTVLASYSKEPYEHYDYSRIEKEGVITKGRITTIKTNYSTTINSHHPKVIQYIYTDNGKEISAVFKTLSPGPVDQLREGDSVDIKVLNNESKISNLEPFSFPFYIFYLIPAVFFLVGSGFFLALIVLRKRRNSLNRTPAF